MNETPTIEAIDIALPEPELTKFERERRAFSRLLPELIPKYWGQWVAIHNEEVVDVGSSSLELSIRVRERVGKVALFIGWVGEERPVERIPHYREIR